MLYSRLPDSWKTDCYALYLSPCMVRGRDVVTGRKCLRPDGFGMAWSPGVPVRVARERGS